MLWSDPPPDQNRSVNCRSRTRIDAIGRCTAILAGSDRTRRSKRGGDDNQRSTNKEEGNRFTHRERPFSI